MSNLDPYFSAKRLWNHAVRSLRLLSSQQRFIAYMTFWVLVFIIVSVAIPPSPDPASIRSSYFHSAQGLFAAAFLTLFAVIVSGIVGGSVCVGLSLCIVYGLGRAHAERWITLCVMLANIFLDAIFFLSYSESWNNHGQMVFISLEGSYPPMAANFITGVCIVLMEQRKLSL